MLCIDEIIKNCLTGIEKLEWSPWQPMHEPTADTGKGFNYFNGTGIYQLQDIGTKENILVGTGKKCNERMRSLYPKPFGAGKRLNTGKIEFVYKNWQTIQFRILPTTTIEQALFIERALLAAKNHRYNT